MGAASSCWRQSSWGRPVFEYTPMQVKLAITGYGKADKKQVMLMTQRLLKLPELPRPDDAADALGPSPSATAGRPPV